VTVKLRDLLQAIAEDPGTSGSALASRFGVTRAAIWKQVKALRAFGAPITARAGHGYRLDAPLELLDERRIATHLREDFARSCPVEVFWQIDSTNSELLRRAQTGMSATTACFAELQSAGRGRRGRSWHAPLGGGLTFSVVHSFSSSMSALAGLSLAIGIGIVRALADLGYGGLGLKWPNDVQVDGRKLAGILIELGGDALGPCHAVIGIGLNLRLDAQAGTPIDQAWTDLASIPGVPLPGRNVLAARLLGRLLEVLDEFEQATFAAFVDEFARHDVLQGQTIRVIGAAAERAGTAVGVDRSGALRVRGATGEYLVDSGEISVRQVSGAGA
jgi:BirA family biotin operon repressor/biotin-[acetyl-CoA-carboxylase] ligase